MDFRRASTIFSPGKLLRLILFSLIGSFFALIFLGFGFFVIFIGAEMTCIRLAMISSPIGRFVGRIILLQPGEPIFPSVVIPVWRKIILMIPLLVYVPMIIIGLWILLQNGFMHQNIIYLIFLANSFPFSDRNLFTLFFSFFLLRAPSLPLW
jgi:hypothetical protein